MNRWALMIIAFVITTGLTMHVYKQEHRPPLFEAYVFNLKSGRSIFIRTPNDRRIIIDGGGNSEIIRMITSIMPFYSKRIEYIFATNEEGKNSSGLIDVLGRFKLGQIVTPSVSLTTLGITSSTDETYKDFKKAVLASGILVKEIADGDVLDLDHDVKLRILFPSSVGFEYSKASSPELLFEITYGDNRIVFIGNATTKVQNHIAKTIVSDENSSTVIIFSNSASPETLSFELIDKIRPDYLVFSKQITKTSKKKKTSAKMKTDPLAGVLDSNRYNVRIGKGVRIVIDKGEMSVSNLR